VADVFREVDEAVRREQLQKLWRRHSKYVYAAAAVLILATAGIAGWREWSEAERAKRAEAYLAASDLGARDETAAIDAFAEIGAEGGGYAVLARLRQAALLAKVGRGKEALEIYDAIAVAGSVPRDYRDLALILYAQQALDMGEAAGVGERLAPLTADDNPWRFSARESIGLAALARGNSAEARSQFLALADDPAAPAGIRARATEIVATLPGQ